MNKWDITVHLRNGEILHGFANANTTDHKEMSDIIFKGCDGFAFMWADGGNRAIGFNRADVSAIEFSLRK